MLPEVIHFNQNAFVKGRTIFDAVRTIDDVIEYPRYKDIPGILVAIEFEKAFDSLTLNFLLRVPHAFNFGLSFIQWIRVLYDNASSCVMNNGFTTGPCALSRGVRQGDPLSPYLFIIALETLAIKIREDDGIKSITIRDEPVKLLSLFADDMTCFIKDSRSYTNLFVTLKIFGECSGLKTNNEKTGALALGNSSSLWEGYSDMPNLCNSIKILGVYFGYDAKQRDELNFRNTLKSLKKTINFWKWHGLSLLRRIQIIKTFAITKIMFKASVFPISKDLIKEAYSLFYYFIWNGKDKVKRNVMISEVEKGGLNMLDIDSVVRTRRVICLKIYLEDYKSPWKAFLNEILIPVGGKLILHCNFDTSKLSIYLPSFYKQCLDAWSEANAKTPSLVHEIANEVIWSNKLLCINKKSVYRRDIADLGFLKICDLFSAKENLNPEQGFFIMGLINSMPASWGLTTKRATTAPVIDLLPDSPAILISNNLVPILDASSKQIYRLFLEKKQTTPTAKVKLAAKYSNIDIDLKSVYSLNLENFSLKF